MVNDAESRRAKAEKLLAESHLKVSYFFDTKISLILLKSSLPLTICLNLLKISIKLSAVQIIRIS